MFQTFIRKLFFLMILMISSCAHVTASSELQLGKKYFETGYYKKAMHELLPLACDNIAEAQYAVGYMYYYGYGVAQDTDTGYFWINRAAAKQFKPAIEALKMLQRNTSSPKSTSTKP
jgi:TPR repeat protein